MISVALLALLATPAMADTTSLTCVVNAGRNVNARDIALNCGVGEAEVAEILAILTRIEGDAAAQKAQLDRMEAMLAGLPQSTISDAALIELSRIYTKDVSDPQTALYELRKAVEVAANIKNQARDNPSTDAFVAEVMRRVADLNDKAEFDAGAEELDRALSLLAAEEENLRQRKIELLENAVAQDILRRDVQSAADRQLRLIELRTGSAPTVDAIRAITDEHYRYALRFGGQYELEFAIALTDRAVEIADSGYLKAVLYNDNGIHWQILAVRGLIESGYANAVAAYRDAQTVYTRADHPVQWATTQNNLAAALQEQGTRTGGPEGAALLGQAVAAYREALTVRTRADHPVDWAQTQNNLAIALADQGTRTGGAEGAALLGQAVTAYREALTVRTRADHPVQWATTQNNLAIALSEQGTRTGGAEGAALLRQAVAAYREALTVRTRADHPVDWAATQNNLAGALQEQGSRTGGPEGAALLGQAVAAFGQALTVYTRADHPVQWAITQENIANAELAIANHDATPDPAPHLTAALQHVEAALTVYDPEHMPYDHGTATTLRDEITAALADH